jgi:D-alanine-D-alanine ligase
MASLLAPWLLRPPQNTKARILFVARHAPQEPAYLRTEYPGDGGYPGYYHRVFETLRTNGYHVTTATQPLALLGPERQVDLVFSLLNRMDFANPEIFVPSLASYLHLPILGAPANTRALAEDKWFSKLVARAAGIPVTAGAVYHTRDALAAAPDFAGPYFIKNRFGAASEGISTDSIQDDWQGARRIAERLLDRGMQVLVEGYVPGIDITVPVLGGPQMLGVVRPNSNKVGGIITEDLKRDDPLGYSLIDVGKTEARLASDVAALWLVAGPMDYFRMDYRFDPDTGARKFLEFNICCHIGRTGAICLAASRFGLEQKDVLGHVVEYSLKRQRRDS